MADTPSGFFPPYKARGPWAPQSLADEEWECAQSVECVLWQLRSGGAQRPAAELLAIAPEHGRLLFDLQPRSGAHNPVALFRLPGGVGLPLMGARIVKSNAAFAQIAGWQWNPQGTARNRQTWFAALDADAGRAVLERMEQAAGARRTGAAR